MAAAPYVAKQAPKKEVNPLIEKRPKNFGIGELVCVCAHDKFLSCDCHMILKVVLFNLSEI